MNKVIKISTVILIKEMFSKWLQSHNNEPLKGIYLRSTGREGYSCYFPIVP